MLRFRAIPTYRVYRLYDMQLRMEEVKERVRMRGMREGGEGEREREEEEGGGREGGGRRRRGGGEEI